ncbi:hypothetical protein BDW22DRAFT_1362294 [Trametopsis cervina]|nr:hypothetical protein BDW22DRAFT_1362294 [Trametopsis cervina]
MSFSLLTIPEVSLTTSNETASGILSVECVPDVEGSARLVLHLGLRALKISPGSIVTLLLAQSGERTYNFQEVFILDEKGSERTKGSVQVIIPPPSEDAKHIVEDIETFDHLLTQYAELSWSYAIPEPPSPVPPPLPARNSALQSSHEQHHVNIKESVEEHVPVEDPSLRGRLVLMDDSNGDIVGELPQTLHITEDASLPKAGKDDNGPVVLELQPEMYDAVTGVRPLGAEGEELLQMREVIVSVIPPEERDWMMKGATLVSQAISSSTSILLSGITSASNYYINHTQPGVRSRPNTPSGSGSTTPNVPSSPTAANAALSRAHAISGQARAVTSKTAEMVGGMIRRAVGGKADPPSSTPSSSVSARPVSPLYQGPPPPYAVYTPKLPPRPPRIEQSFNPTDEKNSEPEERKPLRTIDRVVMSANLVLTTIDDSARRMFEVSNDRLGAVVGHKYGADAQQSTHLTMNTARNVVLVYVDVRGFARHALLKKSGVEFMKARLAHKDKPQAKDTLAPTVTNQAKA